MDDPPLSVSTAVDFGRIPAHLAFAAGRNEIERKYGDVAVELHFRFKKLVMFDCHLTAESIVQLTQLFDSVHALWLKWVEVNDIRI